MAMSTKRAKTVRTKSYKAPSPPVGVIVHPVYAKGTTTLLNRQIEDPPRSVSREGESHITRSLSTRSSLGNRLSNFIRRSERSKTALVNGKLDRTKTSQELKTKSEFANTSNTTVNPYKNDNQSKDNCLAGSSRNYESTNSPVSNGNGNPNCSFTVKGNPLSATKNGGENKRPYQRHITPLKALKYLPVGRFLKLLKPQPERRNSCPGFEASEQEISPKEKDIVDVQGPQWTSEIELHPTTITTEYVNSSASEDISKTGNITENCNDHTSTEDTPKLPPIREFCQTSRSDVNTIQILSGQAQKEFEENNILISQNRCINNTYSLAKKTLSPVEEILELSEDEVKSTVVVISENSQLFPKVGKIKAYQNGNSSQSDHRNSDIFIKQNVIETTTNVSVQSNRENPELISSDISTKGLAVVFITTDDSTIQRIKKHSSAFTYNTNDAKNVGCSIITVLSEPACNNTKNCSFLDSPNDRRSDAEKDNTLIPYIVDCNSPLTNLDEDKAHSPELIGEKIKGISNINKNAESTDENNKTVVTYPLNFTNNTDSTNVTLFHVNGSENDEIPNISTSSQSEIAYAESNNKCYSDNDKSNQKDSFLTNNHLDISYHSTTDISQTDSDKRNIIKHGIQFNNDDKTAVENIANISEEFQNSETQSEFSHYKKNNSNYKQPNEVLIHNSKENSNNHTDYNNNCKDANTIKLNLTIEREQFSKKSVTSNVEDRKTDDDVNDIYEEGKTLCLYKQEENKNQHLCLPSINLKECHVNSNSIIHEEYTNHYSDNDKVNNLVNLTTINDELLDFGERLSCTTPSESSTGDITECYNVKLDAPEEFIVAGFHDFCHTMLSLEESSLEPYDTGTIKKRPEKLTTKSENIDNCTSNENKSIQLCTNIENTEISQINCSPVFDHEDTENTSISEELENQTDKLFEEIQKSKVMEKMIDVKDDEIMEAIQALDRSLLDVQKAFSENSTNMPQQQDSLTPKSQSNITVQVKSHARVPKDDKIQCDNLIEELMLEDISKRILDSPTENIQSNLLGRGIAVTISNRMNHNQICTTSPPDGDENLYESEISEITAENVLDNPKEEFIKYEKQSHPQGEVICTITSQPGIECSFNSPSSSMESMSIASTTIEDTKQNNATSEAKEDTVSLPVSFTSEEQNPDPLPSSPLQVSLNNSPMSHSSQDVVACHRTSPCSVDSGTSSHNQGYFVVVAIDFGTTYSGYAFSFTRDQENIHMMKKWDGGDPGVFNQKTPTTLLLTPEGAFHSFGYSARDYYHDLDTEEAKRWLYFDKFKMTLHHSEHLSLNTEIAAANGKSMLAVDIFAHALRYFKDHALQELSDQSATRILNEDVRWVVTVPAIWKQPAKQFMRAAAYNAGIASPEFSDQLLIALEPEAASIYCRRMRLHQLVPDEVQKSSFRWSTDSKDNQDQNGYNDRETPSIPIMQNQHADSSFSVGTRYMVVDCGGGTVDITVHEILDKHGTLKELQKATGGPYGSMGVDIEFEKLLCDIFGTDFIQQFKAKRPTGFVDLMVAFEARKRNASPYKSNPLNISLPFSFIDYFKKYKGSSVESTIKKSSHKDVKWSQGMLRLEQSAMEKLFYKTVKQIREHIESIVFLPELNIDHLFLVGGFAESLILQKEIKDSFSSKLKVIIPQGVSLAILKGAVLFGLDPTIVNIRRLRMTYGVGVLNRFIHGVHPKEKLVIKDNIQWCADIFDKFVVTDQSVGLGDVVVRSYTPAKAGQSCSVIHIYCSEKDNVYFITDPGVKRCGTLILDLSDSRYVQSREIQTRMMFGDTEIKVSALDVTTGKCVKSEINFLSH